MEKENYSCRYSDQQLIDAINAVKSNSISLRDAERKYKVPKTTLQRKINQGHATKGMRGKNTVLTKLEEKTLVDWSIMCSRRGLPRTPKDIRFAAKDIIDKFPRPNPFKNNLPSADWFKWFLKRNPGIKKRKPEPLSSCSANISESDIKNWWYEMDNNFRRHNLLDILKDPSRIGNTDETNFEFNCKPQKVLVEKGTKTSYMSQTGGNKKGVTVLHTVLADGTYLDPFIIFPYERVPDAVKLAMSKLLGIDYNANKKGWMKHKNFAYYLEHVFVPAMKKRNAKFPVILFCDNHSSHISKPISELAESLGVILVCLYPNSTHLLQPLDVAVFRGLKAAWSDMLLKKRAENGNFKVTMTNFGVLLQELLKTSHNPDAVKNGFRVCGIYEWNVNAIDFSKLLASKRSNKLRTTNVLIPSPTNVSDTNSNDNFDVASDNFSSQSTQDSTIVDELYQPTEPLVTVTSTPDVISPDISYENFSYEQFEFESRPSRYMNVDYSNLNDNSVEQLTHDVHHQLQPEISLHINESNNENYLDPQSPHQDLNDNYQQIETPSTSHEQIEPIEPTDMDVDVICSNSIPSQSMSSDNDTFSSATNIQFNNSTFTPSNSMETQPNICETVFLSSNDSNLSSNPIVNDNITNSESIIINEDELMTKNDVYEKLKDIYGLANFKKYGNKDYEPEHFNEDILMRVLSEFKPITSAEDVLRLPPINKRGGIKKAKKQPYIISSKEFRKFRSDAEQVKQEKMDKAQQEKEAKKAAKVLANKKKAEDKAALDLENKKKKAMERAQKEIEKAEKKAAEILNKFKN